MEIPRGHSVVDGYEGGSLIECGATREATGSRGCSCRVAGNGVGRSPNGVLGRRRRGGSRAGIVAGLLTRVGADVAGRRREGVQKLRIAGAQLTLSTPAEITASRDE